MWKFGCDTLRKRVSLTIIATRPRQFAELFSEALRKKTIDAFGGVPSTGVTPGDLISGAPVNIFDPSENPGANIEYSLPPITHFPDDPFLRVGDTIFEVLTLSGSTYHASLPVNFYRNVWFDGLAARFSDHWTVNPAKAVVPATTVESGVSVSAKYVLA